MLYYSPHVVCFLDVRFMWLNMMNVPDNNMQLIYFTIKMYAHFCIQISVTDQVLEQNCINALIIEGEGLVQ